MNELSGSIDLESTLIRAEALFRKFKRLIEAIDKKPNFPPPRLNLSTVAPALFQANNKKNRPSTPTENNGQQQQPPPPPRSPRDQGKKVITPELRRLLSREVEVLPRKDVASNGDGFLAKSADAHAR